MRIVLRTRRPGCRHNTDSITSTGWHENKNFAQSVTLVAVSYTVCIATYLDDNNNPLVHCSEATVKIFVAKRNMPRAHLYWSACKTVRQQQCGVLLHTVHMYYSLTRSHLPEYFIFSRHVAIFISTCSIY